MKTIVTLILVAGFTVLSCKKEQETEYNNGDSLTMADTLSDSGIEQDTMTTATINSTSPDSTANTSDSINNSR
ncbi:hypothetical protein [uncultured Chryseobacterium sp.]|jgi:hypothetical protein|uniref:hypothetical protein n=1 Tax=uncultured Chryseobacterium sp. TaxID=259322 RepID=UPI00260210BB|nr:hypothetical protein [uncultured Chryseobacterium sp.]